MPTARWILGVLCLALLATAVPAQQVAYEKYELPNGMTVILHEDHSVPQVAVNVWYYVGSKDERERRSGFAHLFEHLMFMGTERVPGGDFDNLMEAGGGFNNASTSEDRTNYYSMGPSELLPTLLWLEADRLEALGEAMTAEKLEKQRAVVRNERRQSYENRPYGKADLRVQEMMYPKGHPYHLPVIGSHEDLEAATVDDVKNFFATYYVPSNASLVVAGDFDPETIKPLVSSWFGTLPRGSDVVHAATEPAKLDEVKRHTLTDDVQFPRTTIVYHSPAHYAPGDAEMDLIAMLLSNGISSRLYQRLIYEEELATDVSAYQASQLLGSLFVVEATARPGVELDTIEKAVDEVIAELAAKPPARVELEKQKAQIEFGAISQLESLLRKADSLNRYQFHYGEPDSFARDLDRYRKAEPDGVQAWARRVLTPDARLILRVIPELKPPETSPLDTQPTVDSSASFEPAMPATFRLDNGVRVHHWQRSELPLVRMRLLLPAGSSSDPAAMAGLAELTTDMLDEGAGDRNAIQFADALDELGASFRTDTNRGSVELDLSSLTRNFENALSLFADAVRRPRFDAKEWERVHELHLQTLAQGLDRPNTVASNVLMRTYFGDGHPFSRPTAGTPDTAGKIGLDDVRAYHPRLYRPDGATILIAGDLSAAEAKRQLNAALGDWKAPHRGEPVKSPRLGPAATAKPRLVIVDRPGAVQTVIRWIMPGPSYGDPQRIRYDLLRTILGGSFTSRLNQNLREQHGYTYGAGCQFVMEPDTGYMIAYSNVRTDVTGASVAEFLREFRGIRGGNISDVEARKARKSQRMDMVQSFAGLGGIVDTATTLVRNDRPFSDAGTELAAVAKLSRDDLNAIARQAVPLEKSLLVLVGDRGQILPQLAGIEGLPEPEVRTVTGDPVEP